MERIKTFKHSITLGSTKYYSSAYLANNNIIFSKDAFVKIGNTLYYSPIKKVVEKVA